MIAVLLLCLGTVSASSLPRIIGGVGIDISYALHQVSLTVLTADNTYFHFCGGSIIASNWVLTAAHCVASNNYYYIQTNDGNRNNVEGTYEVEQIILHPRYDIGTGALPNDIALLRVKGDLTENGHEAIRIPSNNDDDFSPRTCEITGWGNTATGGDASIHPDQLQWTYGRILTSGECSGNWGGNYIHAMHICIYNPSSGMCQGDSGGPMVCDSNGGKVLAGVTSWGSYGCDTASYASVYARVSNYISWIKSNTGIE